MQGFAQGQLGGRPGDRPGQPVVAAVNTGWAMAFTEGLLATAFDKQHPLHPAIVTQLGRRVLSEGLSEARAEARLNVDLHPMIEAKARSPFLQGAFDRSSTCT